MERQQSEGSGAVGARTPRVQTELAAARRMIQDTRSEPEIALDTAVERMLADMAPMSDHADVRVHAQPGAAEETAPAVHVVSRTAQHAAGARAQP